LNIIEEYKMKKITFGERVKIVYLNNMLDKSLKLIYLKYNKYKYNKDRHLFSFK
jgi:hypothetical protein